MKLIQTETAKEFYDVLSKFEVMMATPTLSNGRRKGKSCFSCFVGHAPDNIEGIFDSYKEQSDYIVNLVVVLVGVGLG